MSEPGEPSTGPVTTTSASNGAAPAEGERPGRRKLKRTTRIGLFVSLL